MLVVVCRFALLCVCRWLLCFFFFFNDTATTEIYTLSLHDALPIGARSPSSTAGAASPPTARCPSTGTPCADRKSTRLNSSHANISYAVFCLKKKKKTQGDDQDNALHDCAGTYNA